LNSLAEILKNLGIELDRLSEEEKKIVMEKIRADSKALQNLYNILSNYMEK